MGQIAITLECQVRQDALEESETVLRMLAEVSAADVGNVFYVVGRSQADSTIIRILELYESPEAIATHRANPLVHEWAGRLKSLLVAPLAAHILNVVSDGH